MQIEDQSTQLIIQTPSDKNKGIEHIEKIGRICYQSEDRIGNGTAIDFCKKIARHKHNAMLEMPWLVLRCDTKSSYLITRANFDSNFLHIRTIDGYPYVAGNWRAFLEHFLTLFMNIEDFITDVPSFVADTVSGYTVLLDDEIPKELRAYTTIHKTNRAVTHELVRHRPMSPAQESQRYCAYKKHVTFIRPYMYYYCGENEPKYVLWKQAMEYAEKCYHKRLKYGESPQQARGVLPNDTATQIALTAPIWEWEHILNLRCYIDAEPMMRRLMIPVLNKFDENKWLTGKTLFTDRHRTI